MSGDATTRPDIPALNPEARRKAEAAYRNWWIGADGEGRLHAALFAYERARGSGEVPDWEDRARAAEERVGQLEAALRRHVGSFPEKGVNICGGCLEYSPCPDAGLLGEKP